MRPKTAANTAQIEWLSSIIVFVIALYFVLPGSLLPLIGWNYLGGASEPEKIHPATYLLIVVVGWTLLVDPVFRRRCLAQAETDYALVAFALVAFATSLFAVAARGASAANLIETFGLAIVVRIVIVAIPRGPLAQFRFFVDLLFIVGLASVLAEYVLRRNFIFDAPAFYDPNIRQIVVPEFRAAGIFGHPLTAAGFFSLYAILNLIATPVRLSLGCVTRLLLAAVSFIAIFPTGGRTALLAGGLIVAAYLTGSVLQSIVRGSFSKSGLTLFVVFLTIAGLMVPVLAQLDVFEVMFARFESDDGSAVSREYALQILTNTRLDDLWFGMNQNDVLALQNKFGLVAIENSWINFALVCGLILTMLLLVTYLLFLFWSNAKYCTSGIYYVALFQFILSNATNDLWSKNTGFATGLAVVFCFLRWDMFARPQPGRLPAGAATAPRVSAHTVRPALGARP